MAACLRRCSAAEHDQYETLACQPIMHTFSCLCMTACLYLKVCYPQAPTHRPLQQNPIQFFHSRPLSSSGQVVMLADYLQHGSWLVLCVSDVNAALHPYSRLFLQAQLSLGFKPLQATNTKARSCTRNLALLLHNKHIPTHGSKHADRVKMLTLHKYVTP